MASKTEIAPIEASDMLGLRMVNPGLEYMLRPPATWRRRGAWLSLCVRRMALFVNTMPMKIRFSISAGAYLAVKKAVSHCATVSLGVLSDSHCVMLEWYRGCLSQNGFHQIGTDPFSLDKLACVEMRFAAVRIQESFPKSAMTDVTSGPEAFQRMYSGSSEVQPVTRSLFVSLLNR